MPRETGSLIQALAEGGPPVDGPIRLRRVDRQLDAALKLQEALVRHQLPVGGEGLEDRDPCS